MGGPIGPPLLVSGCANLPVEAAVDHVWRNHAMRTVMLCLLLLAALPAWAGAEAPAPPSASNLLRLHPGPWQLPSHGTRLGMRVDPETGEAAVALRGDRSEEHTSELQ